MLINLDLKKSHVSTWMMSLFAIIILLTGVYSDFFQAPTELTPEMSTYQSLFKPGQILGVQQLILKNNLGTFHFEKSSTDPDTPWVMISPRNLPANSGLLQTILNNLNTVKIKNVHEMDVINISNYSLDNTSIEVTLIGTNDKSTTLKFGLVNPLDNSTYVSLSDQQAIYHIDNIGTSLNTLDLGNFVDTRIFTFDPSTVVDVMLYRGPAKDKKIALLAHKEKGNWVGQSHNILVNEKVQNFLSDLLDLRSPLILDRIDSTLQEEIESYLKKPSYELVIKDSDGNEYNYIVSGLIRSLSNIKLEKWQHFIIKASNRTYPSIMNKKYNSIFNKNDRSMRAFPVKKLFY